MQKLPPIKKIYEAYSAIADGRITMFVENANVLSSNMEAVKKHLQVLK